MKKHEKCYRLCFVKGYDSQQTVTVMNRCAALVMWHSFLDSAYDLYSIVIIPVSVQFVFFYMLYIVVVLCKEIKMN